MPFGTTENPFNTFSWLIFSLLFSILQNSKIPVTLVTLLYISNPFFFPSFIIHFISFLQLRSVLILFCIFPFFQFLVFSPHWVLFFSFLFHLIFLILFLLLLLFVSNLAYSSGRSCWPLGPVYGALFYLVLCCLRFSLFALLSWRV